MATQYDASHATRLEPKSITLLRRGYSLEQLSRDVVAGLVVGIVALPLAIASGVKLSLLSAVARREMPAGVEVFEVQGALFFGAATKFRDSIQQVEAPPRMLIVRLRNVIAIDASGLHELEQLCADSARRGTRVVLSGVHAQPLVALERSGLLERVGEENVCPDIDAALARAHELLAA